MKTMLTPLLLLSVLLIGCAASYSSNDFNESFKEVQLSNNLFKVEYTGGDRFSDEMGTDLTLLRCAEVAQKNGFTYFAVIIEENYSDTSVDVKTSGGGNSYRTAKPALSNTFICFKSAQIGPSYNVGVIIPSLRKKYNISG